MSELPVAEYYEDGVRAFHDDLRRILAVLHVAKLDSKTWLSAVEISRVLRDKVGVQLHWRTIDVLLASAKKGVVQRRKRGSRWEYFILSEGESMVRAPESPIVVVDPSTSVQAVISLHQFLAGLEGEVQVCDPYFDAVTVEHLSSIPVDLPVRLLTHRIDDGGKLRRLLAAMKVEGRILDIRVAPAGHLHDRYIVDGANMLILGTSLNGFGKKQCFVIKAGEDIRQVMLAEFDRLWNISAHWP